MNTIINGNDPRVKRTRQLLQQAFVDLMEEHGFHAITVHSITARATVNRATFYAHFTDKYQLVDVLIREALQQHVNKKLSVAAPMTIEHLQVLTECVFDFRGHLRCRWAVNDKNLKELFIITTQDELCTIIRRWLQHTTPPHITETSSLELTAAFVSWAICGIALQQQISGLTVEAQVAQVVVLLSQGMKLT